MITSGMVSGVAAAADPALPATETVAEIPQEGFEGAPVAGSESQGDPEYQFVLETGEKFKDVQALERAKVEATKTIRERQAERDQLAAENLALRNLLTGQANPVHREPVQDPVVSRKQKYAQHLAGRLDADPQVIDAIVDLSMMIAEDTSTDKVSGIEQNLAQSGIEAFVEANPALTSDFGREVHRKYGGRNGPCRDPQVHLQYIKAEAFEQGIDPASIGLKVGRAAAIAPTPTAGAVVAQRTASQQNGLRTPAPGAGGSPASQYKDSPGVIKAYQSWMRDNPGADDARKAKILATMRRNATPIAKSGGR